MWWRRRRSDGDEQEDEEEEEEEVVCKEDSAIVKGAAAWPELADGAAGAALRARRPTLERNMVQDNPSSRVVNHRRSIPLDSTRAADEGAPPKSTKE